MAHWHTYFFLRFMKYATVILFSSLPCAYLKTVVLLLAMKRKVANNLCGMPFSTQSLSLLTKEVDSLMGFA